MKTNTVTVTHIFSFLSVFFASIAILYLLTSRTYIAVVMVLVAVGFDSLDGLLARRLDQESKLSTAIDSHSDVVIYVVFSFLLLITAWGINYPTIIAGILAMIFGVYRLARFNQLGVESHENEPFIRGITTVHLLYSVIGMLVLNQITSFITPIIASIVVSIVSILMISEIKVFKNRIYPIHLLVLFLLMVTCVYYVFQGY